MKIFEIVDSNQDQILQFSQLLKAECRPFLETTNAEISQFSLPLYRGIHKGLGAPVKIKCPINRKPRDTLSLIHRIMDNFFLDTFGIAYRSNSLFCTGNKDRARSFGDLCLVFPIGTFEFCWSPKVKDLTEWYYYELRRRFPLEKRAFSRPHYWAKDEGNIRLKAAITTILQDSGFIDKRLNAAINSGNEVMIHANEFYLCPIEYEDQLEDLL
jgi:hypothetical protein